MSIFQGRVGIQQRVLPAYRAPFFDGLAASCKGGLQVFAGTPQSQESIHNEPSLLKVARYSLAGNIHLGKGKLYFCWQAGLLRWLRSWRPDVLIVEANPRILSTYLGILLMKLWRRPVVGWGLGVLDWSSPEPVLALRNLVLRSYYRLFDALIAYGSKGAVDYQRAGVPAERLFIAYNAVSSEEAESLSAELASAPGLLAEWKHNLGLSEKPLVLYVGRLIAEKRVDILLQACAPLAGKCELIIVGKGLQRATLESLARQVFPAARFPGELRGRDLAICFAAADLFVLPGTGGLALQEAMIYGKAAVVAAGDGTERDLVRRGGNGLLVPPGDVAALTEAIRTCLADPSRLRQMGEESRRVIVEERNIEAMVASFLGVLRLVAFQKGGEKTINTDELSNDALLSLRDHPDESP